ncbi:hypothetical protein COY06_03455 [Candidatus Peregrinibacteria bacterium CG_4_10_14_0_2_um_filter_41_8]|nr:MAG: hypothetical protein COY06_03455 [Candidatus Peregrinibacteria bacterium CG_4_10_14_0_2_um_filter_41_8]
MIKKVSVGELLHSVPGTQIEHLIADLDQTPVEAVNFKIAPGSEANSLIIRIPDGVVLAIPYAEIEIDVACDRCLQNYKHNLIIENAEQLYYTHKLDDVDVEDHEFGYELISNKHQNIDLNTFLADVINLAIPTTLLCDEDCTGIDYKTQDDTNRNPFAKLLDQ